MRSDWSQELQCYRTRNASLLRLKYTCFCLCSVRIVSGPIFRIFYWDRTQYAATERKPNVILADLIRCCLFTQRGSLWRFLLFVVFILRFVKTGTPTLLSFPNIRSDPAAWKKLNATVLCSNFFSNYSGIFLILPSSESLRFDLSFLIEVLHSSKTTVLCCRILTFWSNLALNNVSTARNDLCFTLCVWSHFESGILKKVRENPVVPGSRAVWN